MSDLADMISAAEAAVVDARSAEAFHGIHADDLDRAVQAHRAQPLINAVRKLAGASARADELKARAARLEQARLDHGAAEASQNEKVTAAAKALDGSRRKLVAAVKQADASLADLHAAARAHDELVAKTAVELRAAGLPASLRDGDSLVEFSTGGGHGRDGVAIRGRWWTRVNADDVVQRSVWALFRSIHGLSAPQTRRAWSGNIDRLQRHSGGLLDAVPLPDAATPQARTASPTPIEAAA